MTGSDPFTAPELAAAFEGREGAGLAVLRTAVDMLTATLEQRALKGLREAIEAGIDTAGLSAALGCNNAAPAPGKPARKLTPRPTAPADDGELLKLLLVELDKGGALSQKALGRRTGASAERVYRVLRAAMTSASHGAGNNFGLAVNGLKWSRKAAS